MNLCAPFPPMEEVDNDVVNGGKGGPSKTGGRHRRVRSSRNRGGETAAAGPSTNLCVGVGNDGASGGNRGALSSSDEDENGGADLIEDEEVWYFSNF